MRIKLLRLREDFESGFIFSLQRYLSCRYKSDSMCTWVRGFVSQSPDSTFLFYANDYLNVIYPSNLARDRLSALTKEFAYHPSLWRHVLQRLYVYWAVRFPFERFAVSATLILKKGGGELRHSVFVPGNHSHRIVHLDNEQCSVFLKLGFNPHFLHADVMARQSYKFLPVPEILEFDKAGGWFVEEKVTGLPVNRLADKHDRESAEALAHCAMNKLYVQTLEIVPFADYMAHLSSIIDRLFRDVSEKLTAEQCLVLKSFERRVYSLVFSSNLAGGSLPLAITHGDYQCGNVLFNDGDVWLIDWEYSQRRSLYYDRFCWLLNSRFSGGLGERINEVISVIENRTLFNDLPVPLARDSEGFLWLFILEDFCVRLYEVASVGVLFVGEGLFDWVAEVRSVNGFRSTQRCALK